MLAPFFPGPGLVWGFFVGLAECIGLTILLRFTGNRATKSFSNP